jgi:cytochrome c oxidase subunit 2
MLNILIQIFSNPIFNDAAEPFQIGFRDGASPGFSGIVALHDSIFFYLVLISIGVFYMLFSVMVNYSATKSPITHKYANHGTLIELV